MLRELLNVDDADWPLLVAYLASLLDSSCAKPILVLSGPSGSGKTTAMAMLKRLVDPAPTVESWGAAREIREWRTLASSAAVVPLDNAHAFSREQFDRFARAATGEASITREYYTTNQPRAVRLKLALMLTTVGLDFIPADFASRVLRIELTPISESAHKGETKLWRRFDRQWSKMLAGLLDHVVSVMAVLPESPPNVRMADFARWLVATDEVLGTHGLQRYKASFSRLSADVVASDQVLNGIVQLLRDRPRWEGTTAELMATLQQHQGVANLRSPEQLSKHVRTHEQELKRVGVGRKELPRGPQGQRLWRYELKNP